MTNLYLATITNPFLGSAYDATNPVGTLSSLVTTIITVLITLAILYFVVYFILSGYNFITSEGDKNTLEIAKKQATYAALGISVVFSVFVVVKILGIVFGIPDLKNLILQVPTMN